MARIPISTLLAQQPPAPDSKAFSDAANDYLTQWRVIERPSGPVVEPYEEGIDRTHLPKFLVPEPPKRGEFLGQMVAFPVPDGFIIGTDAGEWGGSAWWSDPNGKQRRELIKGNILGFAWSRGDVIAVTGLAHLGLREGSLYVISRRQGRWVVSKSVALQGAALAFAPRAGGSVLVLTSSALVQFGGGQLSVLGSVSDMSAFYPNSLVEFQGKYYVGMRHVVMRLSHDGNEFVATWLSPPHR